MVLTVATQAQWINNLYGYGLGEYPVTGFPYAAVPASYPYVTTSQYHAQDELGQARFGYAHPGQAATNYRDAFGNQIGSYAYFNPEGKEVRVSYTADSRGFRVLSNDLPVAPVANLVAPVPVQDTPEVAAAKATHMAAHNAARTRVVAPEAGLTAPVQETAEVAAAPEHAAEAATAAAPVTRRKRQVLNYSSPFAYNYASPFGYNYGTHLNYNYASPFAYNLFGTPFGYNYAHPFGYSYPSYYPFAHNFAAPLAAAPATSNEMTVDAAQTVAADPATTVV